MLSERRPVNVSCAATKPRKHETTKTKTQIFFVVSWFRGFASTTGGSMPLLGRAEFFQERHGTRMGQLDRRLEAKRIGAGRRGRPSSSNSRSEHRRDQRRDAALVLHRDAGAMFDEELNHAVVAERRRNMERGIAGLARRDDAAAETKCGLDRVAHAALRFDFAEVDRLDPAPARRLARSHSG